MWGVAVAAVALAFIVGWFAGEWAASSREERRLRADWLEAAGRRQWERRRDTLS